MKLVCICLVLQLFCCFHQAWTAPACTILKEVSHSEFYNTKHRSLNDVCWLIQPEEGFVVDLDITNVEMEPDCDRFFGTVTTIANNETLRFCDGYKGNVRTNSSVKIQLTFEDTYNNASDSSISFNYEMFRSIFAEKGVNETRKYLISELQNQSYTNGGWGEDTHRAMTALYLAGAISFVDKKEARNQLDLQASSALLMNSSHPLSVNELSMIVNALIATCQNPQKFYDQDLLQILEERATSSMIPNPRAILSICVAGGKIEQATVDLMFYHLMQNPWHTFTNDHKAMSLMALACLKKSSNSFEKNSFALEFFKQSTKNLIKEQRPDGSFGNVYTTALVSQALIETGQVNNNEWKLSSTLQFLMQHMDSSEVDLQMRSLMLPVFSNRSLVDLRQVDCSNRSWSNKDGFGKGTMIQVFYSLFIGDQKKLIKNINLLVPVNSSALDVMEAAQSMDSAFTLQYTRMFNSVIIYKIDKYANDYQAGKVWRLYTMSSFPNGKLVPRDISADKLIVNHWDHLVMWYKETGM